MERTCLKCVDKFEGYRNAKYCPKCNIIVIKEYNREYYRKLSPEKKKERNDKTEEYRKKWYLENKEKVKEYRKKNLHKFREYYKAYNKEYRNNLRAINPVLVKEKRRKTFYKKYYNLTIEEVNSLQSNGCSICGYNKLIEVIALHHKDKNPKNNNPNNLIPLCYSCHYAVHRGYLQI